MDFIDLLFSPIPPIRALKRDLLRPGDHIYSWRGSALNMYSHHGIFVGDNKVIHFTSASSRRRGCDCGQGNSGVILSCLNCFLKRGAVEQYKYGISKLSLFFGSSSGSTVAPSDPPGTVIDRANHLLHHGFGKYDLWKKNCEDFALYCKTGFVVMSNVRGASSQIIKFGGRIRRYKEDLGVRDDKIKLPVKHIFPDEVAECSTNTKKVGGNFMEFKMVISS